jgi:hypothetical protein
LLASLALVLTGCGGGQEPASGALDLLECSEAIFRPSEQGATLHWVGSEPFLARVRWGLDGEDLEFSAELASDGATEFELSRCTPSSRIFVELALRRSRTDPYLVRPLRTFRTRAAAGTEFRVGLIADTHVNALALHPGARENLDSTVARCLADDLDFVVFLGDEAGVHFYGDSTENMNAKTAVARWRLWRQTYTPLLEQVPGFMALGNHEGEAGYYAELKTPSGPLFLQRWGTAARLRYLLNPTGETYSEGGESVDPGEPLQNYFAWTWGDALFIVLDVQRYTTGQPLLAQPDAPASEVRLAVEDWTLGAEQLAWLEKTLKESKARHKLLFAHHLVGGWDYDLEGLDREAPYKYGRGGARYARAGQQALICDLMVRHGARFFFYGHDHIFAHQAAESVEFICCGRPSFLQPRWWRAPGWREAYGRFKDKSARSFLATVGYTRLTLSPERVVIEYIRTAPRPLRGENVSPTSDGVVYRWDSTQASPEVELVR